MMTETGARFHASLTPKERLICPLVATGLPNKLIAWELGTNEQVVKNYLRFMYQKAGMDTRVEFLVFLFRHGVVECPCGKVEGAGQ